MQIFKYNFSAARNVPTLIPFHPCVYPSVILNNYEESRFTDLLRQENMKRLLIFEDVQRYT